jgi:uncharacterized protein (TIGR02246 family)
MRRTAWLGAIVLVTMSALISAQKPDPDAVKLTAEYEAAFNKGDAKAIGALYTEEGTRLGPDGSFLKGRAAIEKAYATGFAGGVLKGAKLTLTHSSSNVVTADVKVLEGTYTATGAVPLKGRYINTVVRKGGQWLLASVVTIPAPPAPPAK